jgi:hypothetical protein
MGAEFGLGACPTAFYSFLLVAIYAQAHRVENRLVVAGNTFLTLFYTVGFRTVIFRGQDYDIQMAKDVTQQ